jgi:hypothetical protein
MGKMHPDSLPEGRRKEQKSLVCSVLWLSWAEDCSAKESHSSKTAAFELNQGSRC